DENEGFTYLHTLHPCNVGGVVATGSPTYRSVYPAFPLICAGYRFCLVYCGAKMSSDMGSRRHWALWGLAAGALMGLTDFTVFCALGLDMRLPGRAVTVEVSILFLATYAGLGFTIGKLMEARARARADACTIEAQLLALEASQQVALQNE